MYHTKKCASIYGSSSCAASCTRGCSLQTRIFIFFSYPTTPPQCPICPSRCQAPKSTVETSSYICDRVRVLRPKRHESHQFFAPGYSTNRIDSSIPQNLASSPQTPSQSHPDDVGQKDRDCRQAHCRKLLTIHLLDVTEKYTCRARV